MIVSISAAVQRNAESQMLTGAELGSLDRDDEFL